MRHPDYTELLRRAVLLAELGRGEVEPNPRVGAFALENGHIVGEGWHPFYGGPHAEEQALQAAQELGASPDTLVVTLEPCSSQSDGKKRPPCTRLLIRAGVREVVVGAVDPDPRHRGTGLEQLQEAGVEVRGPYETAEITRQLERFRYAVQLDRPWVLAKWAMTLDGKTATRTGSSRWISGESALGVAHELRARCDAVAVGIGTVLSDDPELTVRRVEDTQPLRIVFDPEGAIPVKSKLLQSARKTPVLVLVGEELSRSARGRIEKKGAEVVALPTLAPLGTHRRLDPEPALTRIGQHGVRRLLVEGGGRLLWDLLAAGCVDQVTSLIAPKLCGGAGAATALAGTGLDRMQDAIMLEETYSRPLGEGVLFGGFLRSQQIGNGNDVDA